MTTKTKEKKDETNTFIYTDEMIQSIKDEIEKQCKLYLENYPTLKETKKGTAWTSLADYIIEMGQVLEILRQAKVKETDIAESALALKYLVYQKDRTDVQAFAESIKPNAPAQ